MSKAGKLLPKDAEQLIELARRQDWHISKTMSGHIRLQSPKGSIVVFSGSTGDRNSVWDFRARLKHAGLRPAKVKGNEERKIVETPPVKEEPVPAKDGGKTNIGRGKLYELIVEALQKHDKPEGVRIEPILEYINFKTNSGYTRSALNTSLAQYAKIGKIVRVRQGHYRATDAYRVEQPVKVEVALPAVPISIPVLEPTPTPSAPPTPEDEDAELDKALNTIVDALATIDRIVRKTKDTRKKILDILGGIK